MLRLSTNRIISLLGSNRNTHHLEVLSNRDPKTSKDSKTSTIPHSRNSNQLAVFACISYILSPSPATISSGYTEPLFSILSFTGILCAIKQYSSMRWRWMYGVLATVCFAGATSTRSLGVLNVVIVAWMGGVVPFWEAVTGGRGLGWKRSFGVSKIDAGCHAVD
jgi:hypothetical protein